MRTLWALARCSHPEPVVMVTAVCGVLAILAGRAWGTVWVVLAVLAGQLFVGWTNDYCWGKWNLFCNSTFGIFDNHMTSTQRMWSGGGTPVVFAGDGSTFNVNTHKDAVAFLGELRAGTAYEISCHWRGVIAYRAVALTGLATASDQLQNDYTNRASVGLINSDNSVIIHGAEVGVECRY